MRLDWVLDEKSRKALEDFDKKKPMPIDLLFPAKWQIEYDKPYLKINY